MSVSYTHLDVYKRQVQIQQGDVSSSFFLLVIVLLVLLFIRIVSIITLTRPIKNTKCKTICYISNIIMVEFIHQENILGLFQLSIPFYEFRQLVWSSLMCVMGFHDVFHFAYFQEYVRADDKTMKKKTALTHPYK